MSDLISRSELIRYINDNVLGTSDWAKEIRQDFIDMVEKQPTAYDMDKVVEQLEAVKESHDDECGFDDFEFLDCDIAIDIVRKGGLEE